MNQRVLFLEGQQSAVADWLVGTGIEVVRRSDRISSDEMQGYTQNDIIVSHGYRYIISPEILRAFPGQMINLHISLLPWNRGADPNLWSFVERTPKGVSIHNIDEGVDTGAILAQEEVEFECLESHTLATTYKALQARLERLFRKHWPEISLCERVAMPQRPGGSFHRKADRERIQHLLTSGWNTPVRNLMGADRGTLPRTDL